MKSALLVFALLAATISQAQPLGINSVTVDPALPLECETFDVTVAGLNECANYTFDGISSTVVGSTIEVRVDYSVGFICLPAIVPFSETETVGPVPAGSYTLVASRYLNGIFQEQMTQSLAIDACGPDCSTAPTGLSSLLNPSGSVSLSWSAVPGSVACRVRGTNLSTSTTVTTGPIFGVEPTGFTVPASKLDPGTTYEWEVQCACNLSPLETTPWSLPDSFTTPTLRSMDDPGLAVLSPHAIMLKNLDEPAHYGVYDATGRQVASGITDGPVDLAALSAGWYVIRVNGTGLPFVLAN